jgi:hypothetical protein
MRGGVLAFAVLTLASCGEPTVDTPARPPELPAEGIACAHSGAPLVQDCTVERQSGPDGVVLTIRHPDGSFRRFLAGSDARSVIAADGAQQASIAVTEENRTQVTIAGDRYVLPATIKSVAP